MDRDTLRDLRIMCRIMGITMSKLLDEAAKGYVIAGRKAGIFGKKKASALDLMRLFEEGKKLDPHP